MPASIRLQDKTVGHPAHGPTPAIEGNPNHFVNGKPVVCVGDKWQPAGSHTTITSTQGSPNTFSGGKARVRTGDTVSCGDRAGPGSTDVFINGA